MHDCCANCKWCKREQYTFGSSAVCTAGRLNIVKSDDMFIRNDEIFPGIEKFLQKCQKKGYFVYELKSVCGLDSMRYRIQLKEKCYPGYVEYLLKETS